MTSHPELAAGRWRALTLAEQLAHVGSEVDRAIVAWEGDRPDRFDKALARALELFDLTAGDDRWRGHCRREILRLREESVGCSSTTTRWRAPHARSETSGLSLKLR